MCPSSFRSSAHPLSRSPGYGMARNRVQRVYFSNPSNGEPSMGVSLPGTLVRSGTDRATLVRRTYGLVFVSIIVTALGVGFCLNTPSLRDAVAAHPFITMLA